MSRLYLEYRESCEQTRIMVCSICIPINMQRERSLVKLGKPFLLKGNFIKSFGIIEPILGPVVQSIVSLMSSLVV